MDRRRINGPPGGTFPPLLAPALEAKLSVTRPARDRDSNTHRKIFLKTGLTPAAPGSAYLEVQPSSSTGSTPSFLPQQSSLKLSCTVHGPRPLPRSAPFSPQLVLTSHVKFAPFANKTRRGYIRDTSERDLSAHLETALRGVIIGDRWPKAGAEVVVTILEGEDDGWWGDARTASVGGGMGGWGVMNVLAGCITVASAALVEAGIDCVDLVSGGVAAIVRNPDAPQQDSDQGILVIDPAPSEHEEIFASCVVGYLASRDELVETWIKGELGISPEMIIDKAIEASLATRAVLEETLKETVGAKFHLDQPVAAAPAPAQAPVPTTQKSKGKGKGKTHG